MSTSVNDAASGARAVRAGLAAGARRRRLREASRRVRQAAPFVAAAGLAAAALAHRAAWSASVPLAVLVTGAMALAAYFVLAFRAHAVSDALASAIDGEAGFGGELRSAAWFAAREHRDAWADVHVIRAAARLQEVDWKQVYPAIPAPRAGLAAAILTVAAVALATMFPSRDLGPTSAAAMSSALSTQQGSETAIRLADTLPPELLRRLEQLLAAAEAGDRAAVQALSGSTPLRDMLRELAHLSDRQLLDALARALAADPRADQQTADALDVLAERIRRAADSAAMSAAMRDALEQLADELEIARPEQTARSEGADPGAPWAPGSEDAGQTGAAREVEQLTIQFAEEAGGSSGVMLLSNQGAPDGDGAPGGGAGGGAHSTEVPSASTAAIEAALGREVVAAHQDAPGASVEAELPRRTEQGSATAVFTRSTAATFGTAPAVAAPPVPEARRSGVRTYFVRPPQ